MTSPLRTLAVLGLLAAATLAVFLLLDRSSAQDPALEPGFEPPAVATTTTTTPGPLLTQGAVAPGGTDPDGEATTRSGRDTRRAGLLGGRVLDEQDGPLPDATVRLYRIDPAGLRGAPFPDEGPLAEVSSAIDGAFEVAAPAQAWLRVVASAAGYATVGLQVADAGAFAELRLPRAGRLTVSVRDAQDRVIAQASVEATVDQTRLAALSAADGTATLLALPPGDAFLAVAADGFGRVRTGPFTIRPGEETTAAVVLPAVVRLAGQVVDDSDGQPIAGAQVYVAQPGRAGRAQPTGADGAFGPLDAGGARERVFLSAHAPGYGPALEAVVLQDETLQVVQVRLKRAEDWSGRVFGPDGLPAAGATIGYTEDGIAGRVPAATTTDEEGRFRLPPPPPPAPGRRIVLYARHGDLEAALGLRPGMLQPSPLELRLAAGTQVSGRVVDPGGGALAGVQVRLTPAWGELRDPGIPTPPSSRLLLANERGFVGLATATDGQGGWTLVGVAPGAYEVRFAWAGGEAWREETLEVGEGHVAAGLQILGLGRRLAGRVTDARDGALAGVSVRLGNTGGPARWRRARTDADGRYRFTGIAPGIYQHDARLGQLEPVRAQVQVADDADRDDVDLAFEEAAVLVGRVRVDGRPYSGLLRLTLLRERGGGAERTPRAVRVADGGFRWDEAPIGRWIVQARAPGGRLARSAAPLELDPGRRTEVDLVLDPAATLIGTVYAEHDAPVAGARVVLDEDDDGQRRLATTDALGGFAFRDLPPGGYTLAASGRGGAPWSASLALGTGERRERIVRLAPGGQARIRVVDERGRPVAGALVLFRTTAGPLPVANPDRTGRDGTVVRADLPVGPVEVSARDNAGGLGQGSVVIEAGKTADVLVPLAPPDR